MLYLAIDRRYWYRGQGSEESALLTSDTGHRCCIGHLARAAGVPDEILVDELTLDEITRERGLLLPSPWLSWCTAPADEQHLGHNSQDVGVAYSVNDSTEIDDESERETGIIQLFAEHGITLSFFDGTDLTKDETHWHEIGGQP